MPYTSPATQTAGAVATAAYANSLKAATDFLANVPTCRVFHNAAQAVPNNTETLLSFNSERFDNDSMHSTSVNTNRITITTAGVYLVSFTGIMANASDYQEAYAMLRGSGGQSIAFANATRGASAPMFNVSTIYKFAAGNYVEVMVYQKNSAAASRNLQTFSEASQEFMAAWLSLG
jgi:hypothetical protein